MPNVVLPAPCKQQVEYYLSYWDSLDNYRLQESALDKLFFETYPKNDDINDILIKVSSLNDFYSTNIYSVFPVAKHILELDIDDRLERYDPSLVDDIADIVISGKKKRFYSFATKYCSHHKPLQYPIYDDYVGRVLIHFKTKDHFYSFTREDLKKYTVFKDILVRFKKYYGIDEYTLKEIDKYLWQLGKEHFPKKY